MLDKLLHFVYLQLILPLPYFIHFNVLAVLEEIASHLLHFLETLSIFWINVSKFCDTLYINLINGSFHGNLIFDTLKHTQISWLHIYTNAFR